MKLRIFNYQISLAKQSKVYKDDNCKDFVNKGKKFSGYAIQFAIGIYKIKEGTFTGINPLGIVEEGVPVTPKAE